MPEDKPVYCNMCGKELDIIDKNADCKFQVHPGFGSKYDLCCVSVRLCCDCFDSFVEKCMIIPVKGYFE